MNRRVAVTGMGVLTPAGNTLESFWENSLAGKAGYGLVHDYDGCPAVKNHVVGKIPPFDPMGDAADSKKKARMGRPAYLAVNAAVMAARRAGLGKGNFSASRAGVCVANAIADTPFSETVYRVTREGGNAPNHLYEKGMFTPISHAVSRQFGLEGESLVMSTGCTGGVDAVGYGYLSIARGRHDLMFCGGAEAPLTAMTLASFDTIKALAQYDGEPEHASRPFDAKRNGFVLSEGCAILVLEELEHARLRKAPILGEIRGFASGNNAYHMVSLPENGAALARVISEALADAGMEPREIGMINAHGSSTIKNDIFETDAYRQAFGKWAASIPITAAKSITGHPLAAASAIAIAQSLLSLEYGWVPPIANFEKKGEKCDLCYVTGRGRRLEIPAALVTASGFSGIHSAMVLTGTNLRRRGIHDQT